MNRLTAIQRQCLDIVRDEYGVSDARVVSGGKHPRLEFTYAGVSYSKVLPHGNTPDYGHSANNYAAGLRRDLGEPPVKPGRVKRNLEDMMPTINDLIEPRERAGLEALSAGGLVAPGGLGLPGPVAKPAEHSEVFRGYVSLRRSAHPNRTRIRLVIQETLYRAFGHQGQVRMTMTEPDNFEVVPIPPGSGLNLPRFGRMARGMREFASEAVVPLTPEVEFYGNSPAEILLVGGHLLVRVLEKTPYTPLPKTSRSKRPQPTGGIGSPVIKPPEIAELAVVSRPSPPWGLIGKAMDPMQPVEHQRGAPQIPPTGDDVRACLAALRRIEEMTDYRLVKLKEGEHQRWVFQARID